MSVDGHRDWKEKYVGIQRVRRQREHSLLCQHWYTHLGAIERVGGRRRMIHLCATPTIHIWNALTTLLANMFILAIASVDYVMKETNSNF